jgi:beta-phosphoglucomutase-like phosphatase (HAD superfamily)
VLSNEDVKKAKPDPEIYNKMIDKMNLHPSECLILEDNKNGIKAALDSGAHLLEIQTVNDVNYEAIKHRVMEVENK